VFTYLSPWFSSPLIWYHQHVIGHHSYTNIPAKDPDLYHAPKFWRFQSSLRFTSLHRYQEYTTIILWIFSVPTLLLLKPLGTLASGLYNRAVVLQKVSLFRRILHVLGRILVASSLYAWPWFMTEWSFFKQFCFAFVPISVYSLWFMGWSQVNHHTDETSESFHPNWYRHQVMTSHTIAPQSAVAFWLSGGLNLQIEHHLFPFINQEHLIPLQPLIEAAARKHNVPYTKSNTVIEAFVKLWNHLHILSIPPKVTTTTPGSKETKNTNNTNHHRTNGPKID
jgi:fatty acid desaturase